MNDKEQSMDGAVASAGTKSTESDPNGRGQTTASEDSGIVDAIRAGHHRTALSLCARQHGASIGRLCMAICGSQAEADDLTQETLLTAYDGFASYRGEGSLRAWLLGIARRRCARHIERRSRREAKLRLVRDASVQPETEELLSARRRAEQTRAALERVRPSEREALLLRFMSDLSYRDLGSACGIEEATARKRVSRAIAKLRDVLAEEYANEG
jgi:RNA polymerase sigma-70 factor (ECF subfamily)